MPRQSHRRRIYETLRDRVQRGEIARGDKLVDTVVAEEFGVSRMPVRDALMQLTHEGYLESTSRGFTLPNLSEAKILEVFLLRRLLEPYAAASATLAMTEMDIGRMQEAVADTTATLTNGDIGLMYRASEVFRNVWTGAIPNEELRQTILRYMAQIQTVRVATLSESASHKIMVEGQVAIFTAFRNRDALAVKDRMTEFVLHGEECYRSYLHALPKDRSTSVTA